MADISDRTRVVLSFQDIFSEDERENISTLIKDIPSRQALQIVAHFSARYHVNEGNLEIQGEAIKQWFGRLDKRLKNRFLDAALPFMKRNNYLFINQPSCLYLIQEILLNYNELEARDLKPEDEYNLLKAYMLASEWSVKVSNTITSDGIKDLDHFVKLTLKTQFPISDLKFSREFYLQAYKAIRFFEFCIETTGFKEVIDDFVKTTRLSDWKEYLKSILQIYISHLLKFDGPNKSVLNFSEQNHVTEFLDYLTLDLSAFEAKSDFISIREKPIVKLKDGSYLFLNLDLFVDKIFEGILFDIYSSISGNKYEGLNTSSFTNFKSVIGEKFTEEVLLYEALNYIHQDDWISYSGKELSEKIIGVPDFYLRRRSKVFLFECKDTLISSKAKNSYDFETIKNEITEKLIEGSGEKNKGVSQILSFISTLNSGVMYEFDEFNPNSSKYYPIITVTDRALDEHGVNYIFESSFPELIKKFNLEEYRFQIPILIQLDDLIKFADLFRDQDIKLNSVFDSYVASLKSEDYFRQTYSFSDFLKIKAFKLSTKPSKLIDEKLKVIFE